MEGAAGNVIAVDTAVPEGALLLPTFTVHSLPYAQAPTAPMAANGHQWGPEGS